MRNRSIGPFHDEYIPFEDVLEARAHRHERLLEVRQDLLGLGCQVALADYRAVGRNRVLPPM